MVGGGTAGLTLASRLVEQKAGSVAVIEAGTFYELSNGNLSHIPALDYYWISPEPVDSSWQPGADWGYVTEPQVGQNNKQYHYARGKMLGGSSARNYMIYHRQTEGVHQKWADAVDDDSYAWDAFFPFYKKSVDFSPPNNRVRIANATPSYDPGAFKGGKNPALSVGYPNYVHSFATWAVKGLEQIGIPIRKNAFHAGGLLGQAYNTLTIQPDTMVRESSASAFLPRSLDDADFYVYQLTLAKKILFDDDKKATGVQVETLGRNYTLTARKEVILSAGAFGSPQLLQVSGVGPSELLSSLGIPVVADRPGVGQNMEDHVTTGIAHRVNVVTGSALGTVPGFFAEQTTLFATRGEGMLTNPYLDVLGWENFPKATRGQLLPADTRKLLESEYPQDWPEMEYMVVGVPVGTVDPTDRANYASLSFAITTPQSRGTVNITSPDAAVHPAIDPRFLTAKADVDVAVAAFKRIRQFWNTKAMRTIRIPGVNGTESSSELFPGAEIETDDEIAALIRNNSQTVWHASCTCRMGKEDDETAVVDSQARVYGVKGLRVVDAAAFPFLPPGHPQAVVCKFL